MKIDDNHLCRRGFAKSLLSRVTRSRFSLEISRRRSRNSRQKIISENKKSFYYDCGPYFNHHFQSQQTAFYINIYTISATLARKGRCASYFRNKKRFAVQAPGNSRLRIMIIWSPCSGLRPVLVHNLIRISTNVNEQ